MNQQGKAKVFKELHEKGAPLVLRNVWDAGSAKAVAEAGARALATGSWSVAAAHGFSDGEKIPLSLVLANLERIVSGVDLPVSLDFEGAYSVAPEGVAKNIRAVTEAGAIGINFEDQVIGAKGLHDLELQCERIASARDAASGVGLDLFINARTDVYLQTKPADRSEQHLAEVIERGVAYTKAGASGFFVPGLGDAATIETICKAVSLPVNIMLMDDSFTVQELADLGVSRISAGPQPYREAMLTLT